MSLIKPSTEEALRDIVETNRTDKAITQAQCPYFNFTYEEALYSRQLRLHVRKRVDMDLGRHGLKAML